FYMAYHDAEWGVPEYDDRALYEKLILDGFQAGLSWITILRKRENFRRAFDNFEPAKIARYNAKKVHALMNDAGIIRNRAKIESADIAHGLARVARWNGQTSGAHIFSVAQHTLLVEAVMREQTPRVDARVRLAALLHDAPEYVIGDMISPFKVVLGGDYKTVEMRLLSAIHVRFGLPPVLSVDIERQIKDADRGAAYLEATQLAGFAQA